MADRQIVYPGAIPLDTDILSIQRNMMVALGFLAQATLGTGTYVDGLACTQTTVASMVVNVGPGSIVSLSTVDATAFGSLASDSTDNLVKMGINLGTTPFTLTAPVVAGQSINYLIEASFLESDTNAVVLPYYNASNPAMPYSGPSNSGTAQNTQRIQRAQLQLKAGASATTGTQTTPSVDSGWVGLWVITVNYGMTSVTNSAISAYLGAPFIPAKLPNVRGNNVQTFTSSGTFYVPNGVTALEVEVWGAGGGGGGAALGYGGGGGGGGGYAKKLIKSLTPGAAVTVTVGAGAASAGGGVSGTAGGTSSFGAYVTATGGGGGVANSSVGGTGGVGAGGDENIPGQPGNGGSIFSSTTIMGGAGGGSPRGGPGTQFGITAAGGYFAGSAGCFPGGGGSGGAATSSASSYGAGGTSAPGLVVVRW